MEYSEFIEELEISLQDQMKGETAFFDSCADHAKKWRRA